MKRVASLTTVLLCVLCLVGSAMAQSATKDECMAKAKEAAQMIKQKGLDAEVAEINKKDGQFVWKDTYVFLMDLNGTMLAHPMSPTLIGKNLLATPDKAGKMFFQDFVAAAKKGEGWVTYLWPKPGSDTPVKKTTYIYRVPGKDLFVGAGIYE
jgi:cytochrome c